ncbi:TPA: hypothetical protein DEW47_00610 [Patescibacteria group bacterium]|nr:MAG: hypothetical protein UT83_C0008G0027 [Parcubacteria group bacterium GW2011_GWA2_40_143]KKR59939.1 MAG: hypothetical protein UT97_C0008G0029 [Parcubacteria group bacterium GW2011_GWC2_40_31]KKR74112.1 MAG: hypothetical protein UU18_C0034G0008 [Parcubacteria group bacterium GW2011_GWB2_40_8]KKR75309.1 MAG: hypothetical protein UU20_C0057G0007 [Parcubacteria group bacterium GW2011_GWE2_40_8]KKR81969.1 MAG: hypothetical protein UU28_C0016G0002 [Parcubacteria group bacterium GW2011_GWD2_40_9
MHNQRGFIGVGILIAIVLGLIVVGGGAYFVMQQNSLSPTPSENNLDTLPTTSSQTTGTTANPAPTQTSQNISPAAPQNGWKTVPASASSGLVVEYPTYLKVTSNESAPIAHIEFEESTSDLVRIFVSAANIIPANKNLQSWLESYDYFKHQYRSQKYESYKRKDGVEVLASFGNAQSYDDAFIRVGTAVLYIKNGVNENTKAKKDDFREIIERIKLPSSIKVGAVASSEFSCIVGSDELMTLYWGTQYRKANPTIPFIYAQGSYCESPDGSKLATMGYFDNGQVPNKATQAIVLFGKDEKIVRTYKDNFCHTVGDFGSPLIVSVEQGMLNMFCLSGDGGYTAFNVYQAPLETLVPTEAKPNTPVYNSVKTAVEKLYNIDFSQRNLF